MKKDYIIGIVLLVIIIIAGSIMWFTRQPAQAPIVQPNPPAPVQKLVTYYCDQGSLTAVYTNDQVVLTLSPQRKVTLPQVESGSGTRYEAEALSFSSKGSYAFLIDGGQTIFANCVSGTVTSAGTTGQKFTDDAKTFSFIYPAYAVLSGGDGTYVQNWMTNTTSSGMLLAKVTVSRDQQPKTNFAGATFTVGTSSDSQAVANCLKGLNGSLVATSTVSINQVPYTVVRTDDAGAGNFYQTTSYRAVRNNQCYAIEYTIHSTNIANYSPDQGIKKFDQVQADTMLQAIAVSFSWL